MSSQKTGSKVIVITGASSGIGKATAQALVDEGNKVALIARSEDKLDDLVAELGEANAFAVTADVSDFNDLEKAFSKVATLLNAFSKSLKSLTSAVTAKALASPSSATKSSSLSSLLAIKATLLPSSTSACAVALPIPLDAPVITITFEPVF